MAKARITPLGTRLYIGWHSDWRWLAKRKQHIDIDWFYLNTEYDRTVPNFRLLVALLGFGVGITLRLPWSTPESIAAQQEFAQAEANPDGMEQIAEVDGVKIMAPVGMLEGLPADIRRKILTEAVPEIHRHAQADIAKSKQQKE